MYFRIPIAAPSVNVTGKEARKVGRADLERAVNAYVSGKLDPNTRYSITVRYTGEWNTKTGKPRRRDSSNLDKPLFDALARKLGVDDSWFVNNGRNVLPCVHSTSGEVVELWFQKVSG